MRLRHSLYILAVLLFCACSETKYVPEGEYLLNKVSVKCAPKTKGVDPSDMKAYARQHGNSRWFSAMKVPLATYSLSGRDSTKWLNRMLRSIGEAPVLYDSMSTRKSMEDMQMQLVNMGFLRASVDAMTKTRDKRVDVTYLLHPGPSYSIRHVDYVIHDSLIADLLHMDKEENRGLKSGMRFSVENLDTERKRITRILNNQGYYRFNKEFITYQADSVAGSHEIDIVLVLRQQRDRDGMEFPHQRYLVRDIRYSSGDPEDSVIHLRQGVLHRNTFIRENGYYSAEDLQNTYNHFGRLGAVRYTNISWEEKPDSSLLDCQIQVSTNKPSTISFQPEGTNTAGDLGFALSLTYQNRNLFKGSENLSIELRGAYEAIKGLEGYSNHNFLEYSLETKLTFPRFIAPFLPSGFQRRTNATSEVSLLYDLQNRPEFHRRVFSVGWRYKWDNPNHHDHYRIDLLDLNYISMPWISETFKREYLDDTSSRNAILRYNYENLFIMKFGVGYIYNNGIIAIKANAETSGNLLGLAARTFGFHKNEEGQYTFLDIAYAQYVKADIDLTRNIKFNYHNHLVFHAGLGIAYPYGNSTILPFEKRYFSGGANSVRGWSVRSLGPGKYISKDGRIDFINQTGDMKLDLNMEYRAHLFWKLGLALFVDAGNIWTLRSYDEQPGGQFKFSEFWKQLAVSYGLGFRFNFDYFILRFDMGMKAINPAYQEGDEHYPIVHPRLSRDFAFHFAVGLPF
ncbi:MAG: BamA/TamA family outer membrane protein [Prevotella sp.]|nr:BamA/TamA family outer membrane protein [Prevotella sp.]